MKNIFLVILLVFCAAASASVDKNSDKQQISPAKQEKCPPSIAKSGPGLAASIETMFRSVWVMYSSDKNCFIKALQANQPIVNVYIKFLYKKPLVTEELQIHEGLIEKAVRAIAMICEDITDSVDFEYQTMKEVAKNPGPEMHCIYAYGVDHGMIEKSLANFRKPEDDQKCKPYQELAAKVLSTADKGVRHTRIDSEFSACMNDKESELKPQNMKALLTSIVLHDLTKKQEDLVFQKVSNFMKRTYLWTLECVHELSIDFELKTCGPEPLGEKVE